MVMGGNSVSDFDVLKQLGVAAYHCNGIGSADDMELAPGPRLLGVIVHQVRDILRRRFLVGDIRVYVPLRENTWNLKGNQVPDAIGMHDRVFLFYDIASQKYFGTVTCTVYFSSLYFGKCIPTTSKSHVDGYITNLAVFERWQNVLVVAQAVCADGLR